MSIIKAKILQITSQNIRLNSINSLKGEGIEVARLKNEGELNIRLITVVELLDKRRTLLE